MKIILNTESLSDLLLMHVLIKGVATADLRTRETDIASIVTLNVKDS